jgi:hypothetical protein
VILWFHARIHRAELRALIAQVPIYGDQHRLRRLLACPHCGDDCFAEH